MNTSGAMTPMPLYQSHKKVWALQIESVKDLGTDTTTDENPIVEVTFKDPVFAPRRFNLHGKPTPQAGWYFVQYEDGYESFSPAEQFEKGNTPVDPAGRGQILGLGGLLALEVAAAEHRVGRGADLRSFPQSDIDNWLSYHAPTPEQLIQYNEIRTAAKIFAETINRHVPAGADKSAAIRLLRETVMTANAGIACHQDPKPRPIIAELEKILNSEQDTPITVKPDGSITTESE